MAQLRTKFLYFRNNTINFGSIIKEFCGCLEVQSFVLSMKFRPIAISGGGVGCVLKTASFIHNFSKHECFWSYLFQFSSKSSETRYYCTSCILSHGHDLWLDKNTVVGEEFIVISEILWFAGAEISENPPEK
jgi:hypothetical protein